MSESTTAAEGKAEGEQDELRALIGEAVPREQWVKILQWLAQSENVKMIELLLKYRFGPPAATATFGTLRTGPQTGPMVQLMLPIREGSTHAADQVGAAQGAAETVSRKHRGRAALRRSGGRGKK